MDALTRDNPFPLLLPFPNAMKHRTSRPRFAPLALLALLVTVPALIPLGGCGGEGGVGSAEFGSTPVFSRRERFARISRNINLELQMMNDDIDRLLLLSPESGLTYWNVP